MVLVPLFFKAARRASVATRQRARRVVRPIRQQVANRFAVQLVLRTAREVKEDDVPHTAAGIAYYALFSLFPLTLGILALFGIFLPDRPEVREQFVQFVGGYLPGSEDIIGKTVTSIQRSQTALNLVGVVSIVALFWAASAVFGAISRAVNRAWDIHNDRPFLIAKARHLLMALGVGILFLVSISLTTLEQVVVSGAGVNHRTIAFLDTLVAGFLLRAFPYAVTLAAFLVVYKFIPNTTTHWRYVWPGALLSAVLYETGKQVFVFYLARFARYSDVYGSLSSIIVLLLWVYISSIILLVGAEVSSEYDRMKRGAAAGQLGAREYHRENARGRG